MATRAMKACPGPPKSVPPGPGLRAAQRPPVAEQPAEGATSPRRDSASQPRQLPPPQGSSPHLIWRTTGAGQLRVPGSLRAVDVKGGFRYSLDMEIYLATENTHKVRELAAIFAGHRIITPIEAGVDYSFEETGTTYFENSYGKARALFEKVQAPVIADDSGISLPALDGAPGIYSSRYGSPGDGEILETSERNRYLLSKMAHIQEEENRKAFFVSCMVLILEDYRFFVAQETVEGVLTREPRGSGGFGYDPLFYLYPHGCTVAELPEEEKNRISHRGKAGARLAVLLEGLDG